MTAREFLASIRGGTLTTAQTYEYFRLSETFSPHIARGVTTPAPLPPPEPFKPSVPLLSELKDALQQGSEERIAKFV